VNNGQLGVVIESGTVTDTSSLSLTSFAIQTPPPSGTEPVATNRLAAFQLELNDANGVEIERFNKPVRLIVDLRSHGIDLDEVGGRFYLAYEDEENPGEWREVDIDSYGRDGLISTETDHFSNWSAGWRPEAWALEWKPPVTNEFTGAASYGYGFNIPPGRAGLQPNVSLSYSSAALRGAIRQTSMGTVASGWSLSDISITRTKIENGASWWTFHDEFRLTMSGVGGRLVHQGQANGGELYFVEDNPQMRVYNYGGNSWAENQTGNSYWIVMDGSGSQYRLGYTASAVSYQGVDSLDADSDYDAVDIIAWHVDTITDAFGNQINYEYTRPGRFDSWGFWCPWGGNCEWKVYTFNSQVTEISYNFDDRITSVPANNTVARLRNSATAGSRITFAYDANDGNRLATVNVYHGNFPHPSRRYVIEAVTWQIASPGNCDAKQQTVKSDTRAIDWIEEQSIDPQTGAFISALPRTSFEHQTLPHGDGGCFLYKYLNAVENGYGGRTEINYASDNRQVGTYTRCSGSEACTVKYPSMGYNYVVNTVKQYDGIQANPLVMEYLYTGRCYDQIDSCPQPESIEDTVGTIGGHNVVKVTTKSGGSVLNSQETAYYLATERFGKPSWSKFRDENGTVLTRNVTTYFVAGFGSPNVRFTYADDVRNYTYDNGEASSYLSNKTRYEYQPSRQGGTQYGNVTDIYEYDDANTNNNSPDRTTRRWYKANTTEDNWIIRQTSEGIYEGGSWNSLLATWNYYDFGNHGDAPVQGRLTRTRQLMPNEIECSHVNNNGGSNCDTAYQTVDQDFTYDDYGNLKTSTSYSDYGHQTQDSIAPENWHLKDVTPLQRGAVASTSTIAYDAGYNLYPVAFTNPAGQMQTFDYYGFRVHPTNMYNQNWTVPLDSFQIQPGLLYRVGKLGDVDAVESLYEYDPFGRLYQTYGPGDSQGALSDAWDGEPLTRYRYWDTTWTNSSLFLNPQGDKPFRISSHTRPVEYGSGAEYVMKELTYYDGFGRPIQAQTLSTAVDGQSERRTLVSTTEYNALGQTACATAPYDVIETSWPNNSFDNSSCQSHPFTTTTYDAQGRPLFVTAPDGNQTGHRYAINDSQGPVQSHHNIIDANQRRTKMSYNSRGELVTVRELTGNCAPYWGYNCEVGETEWDVYAETAYAYDLMGNLTTVTDALNNETTMVYDALGRKTSMNDPDMGDWGYKYNAAGSLIDQVDAKNNHLCFFYDELGRMTDKNTSGTTPCPTMAAAKTSDDWLATYAYDSASHGIGQLARVEWAPGEGEANYETYAYDSFGRMTAQTRAIDGQEYTMSTVAFDSLNRPTQVQYPDGELINIDYDHEGENGLTSDNSGQQTSLVNDVRYNMRGQITAMERGALNGSADISYTYYGEADNFRLEQMSSGSLIDFSYAYDAVGNISSITDHLLNGTGSGGTVETFEYDHLNRLVSAAVPEVTLPDTSVIAGYDFTYTYDEIGNMQSKNGEVYYYTPATHPHPTHTQPHAVTAIGNDTFSYDANGNMLTRDDGGVTYNQEWDVENRLAAVTNTTTGETTRFLYDHSGQRVKTVQPGDVVKVIHTPFPNYEVEKWVDPPTVSITANGQSPLSVNYGASFTLAWNSEGADSCVASGSWQQFDLPIGGTQVMQGIYGGNHNYTITCENAAGSSSATVLVTVAMPPPTITFLANGEKSLSVELGTLYLLAWNTDSLTSTCTSSGAWQGGRASSGSLKMSPKFEGTYTYNLTCSNSGGASATQTVVVTVSNIGINPPKFDMVVRIEEGEMGAPLAFTNSEEPLLSGGDEGSGVNAPAPVQVTTITRKTYSLAGQAIAVRVSGVPDPDLVSVSPLNNGLACIDNAAGSGYLMYSEESVHTRFAAVPPHGNNADHFICVRYSNGAWQYDNNSTYTPFTPHTSDVLAATINFSTDVITSLEGSHDMVYGITAGYVSGDLVYTANMWGGDSNSGEFGISGNRFTPVNVGNGLFYIHSDHLGSSNAMSDESGVQVGTTTRYTPFGDYRMDGQSDITDRGFTGHKENRYINLTYMNARYYLPGTGRFLSADTIVPDPTNPQSLNRYSYVFNSPLIFSDPSGHCAEAGDDSCWGYYDRSMQLCQECRDLGWAQFGYNFQEEMFNLVNSGWRPAEATYKGLDAIGIVGSISGGAGVSGQIAIELVYNLESDDITLFVILGLGATAGVELGGDAVVELIYNIGDDNLEYKGIFHYAELGFSVGGGGVVGHAWAPGDLVWGHRKANSDYVGIKGGMGAYIATGRVEYIPIATTNLTTGETTFHASDYMYGDMAPVGGLNEFISPTGPHRALYKALETAVSEYN